MEKKKITPFIMVLIVFSAILLVSLTAYCLSKILAANIEGYIEGVPEKSSKGKVILTSRGCCYWAEDVTVYILDENDNKIVIIEDMVIANGIKNRR